MPQRQQVPCAGNCGALVWASADGVLSLPPGVATCQACRRAGRAPAAAYHLRPRPVPCPVCAIPFQPQRCARGLTKTCSPFCSGLLRSGASPLPGERYASRRARDRLKCARRRAKRTLNFVEFVDPLIVFERDGWRCHICRRKVNRRLSGNARMGPTVDHLIPLADGGDHSYANTALAHRACNSHKGVTAGNTQLALLG